MKTLHSITLRLAAALIFCTAKAAEPAAPSAAELAGRLSALRQDGTAYVRLKMEVKKTGGAGSAVQLQIKSRRTDKATELVYQVLWPKERKGEAVLLRKVGERPASGALFEPGGTIRTLDAGQMKEALFGSDLTYEDLLDDFFAWEHQALAGTETVDRVNCQILESKPGAGQRSSYARVRTWVDARRFVPLRVEKYAASGQLVRRIETTSVATDDQRHPIPANLTVRSARGDSTTELDGSKIRHDAAFTDRDFTPDGLKELTPPRFSAE